MVEIDVGLGIHPIESKVRPGRRAAEPFSKSIRMDGQRVHRVVLHVTPNQEKLLGILCTALEASRTELFDIVLERHGCDQDTVLAFARKYYEPTKFGMIHNTSLDELSYPIFLRLYASLVRIIPRERKNMVCGLIFASLALAYHDELLTAEDPRLLGLRKYLWRDYKGNNE